VTTTQQSTGPARERARRLEPAAIVEAGLRLGSVRGTETISVRALGAELEVDPTAVYRHFRSKEDLMRALLDALHLQVLGRLTTPAAWQDRLVELADVTLEVHLAHAAIAMEAVTLTTGGPGEARTIEYILAAFSEAGLSDEDLVQHYALLGSYMLSRTAAIAHAHSARGQDEDTDWIDTPLLLDPARQPHATALVGQLSSLKDEEIYRLGIRSIIQSAERAAATT
jgi:AcrR family transcriptional regulator